MCRTLPYLILTLFLGIMIPGMVQGSTGADDIQMKLEPNIIDIGATYNGAAIKITGRVPANTEAVVYVMGHRKDTEFRKKGKALGILWMNMDTVVFHGVPDLYLVYTGPNVDVKTLPVGFEAIKKEIQITPLSEDKDFLFNEFIKLKTREELYSISLGAVKYGKISNGMKQFQCVVILPSKLVPGSYEANVVAINSGKVVAKSKETIRVREKGLPNLVATLAFTHSTTYGVLATVIAIIAGLIMGVIFKGSKGGH